MGRREQSGAGAATCRRVGRRGSRCQWVRLAYDQGGATQPAEEEPTVQEGVDDVADPVMTADDFVAMRPAIHSAGRPSRLRLAEIVQEPELRAVLTS